MCMLISSDEPDLILVTEVIPKAQQLPLSPAQLHIPGYTLYMNFDPSSSHLGRSGMRGVCAYASDNLKVSEVSFDFASVEHVWLSVSLAGGDCLLIGCVYRSPSGRGEEHARDIARLFQQATARAHSHLVIVGDFNLPQIDWEEEASPAPDTHLSQAFLDTVHDNLLYQHVHLPTRYRVGESPSLLDLVFSNEEGMIRDLEYFPGLANSDHVVLRFNIICSMDAGHSGGPKQVKIDYERLSAALELCNWDALSHLEMEEAYAAFKTRVTNAVEACSRSVSSHRRKNLYVDRTALQLKKRKKELWSKYCQSLDVIDHARFARCRNRLRALTRRLRREHEAKLAEEIKRNPKAFWKYAHSRLKTRCRVEDLLDGNGALVSDNQEKARVLSEFFSSVFTVEPAGASPELTIDYQGPLLVDVEVSPQKIGEKLSALRASSSPGPDGIQSRLLRDSARTLSAPLSVLYRKSLDSGRLPEEWKIGDVVPIYKKGDRRLPASYRPVSLTAVPCKVLESIIRDALLQHFTDNGLLDGAQHGFLPARSCSTQLLETIEDWSAAIEDGDPLDVAYLDFAKAFDSVPHARLIGKLQSYGVRGKLLRWIEAFLVGRRQRVQVQGAKSDWVPVTSGIPQGSVLGPTLFTIYVNDLPREVSSCIKLFADDTKIYCRLRRDSDSLLHTDLEALAKWSEEWLLPFNTSKCKIMHLGRQNPETEYSMNGKKLQTESEERDLGIIIDNHLKFDRQAASAVSKASQMLAVVRRSFANIDEHTLPLLYKAMVRPYLEYGNVIWGPFRKTDQKRIERVQRRATRMVEAVRHRSYPERLRYLGLPSLHYRRRRGDMIVVYQLFHGGLNINPETFLTKSRVRHTRGHPWKLEKPRARSLTRRNTFSARIVNDWNSLPTDVVSAGTLNQFKARLDRHWNHVKYLTPYP